MNKIDVDKLTLFYDKLTKLTSDCEENWYLVKRIMSEMYPDGLPECIKGTEGIAQQYLFHWRRNI